MRSHLNYLLNRSIRSFTTANKSYSDKTKFLKELKSVRGEKYAEETIPTKRLLNNLRDMQSWRSSVSPRPDKSSDYKSAIKAISLLSQDGRSDLRIGDIERVLTDENGITWRMIFHLLQYELTPELEGLNAKEMAMVRFCSVHGIGKVYARAFAQEGARSYDNLLAWESKEKGLGKNVSAAQKLAVQYREEMDELVPREEIRVFDGLFKEALGKVDPAFRHEIMGSYRRNEPISSDIDMVIWHPSYQKRDPEDHSPKKSLVEDSLMYKVKEALLNAGLLEEGKIFTQGNKKLIALTRLPGPTSIHRQIDIRLCPIESLPYMLLGNTGDDELMKRLRAKAIGKGWVLNEYGMAERDGPEVYSIKWTVDFFRTVLNEMLMIKELIKEGTYKVVKDEKDIFKLLGCRYLKPEERSYHKWKHIL